MTNPEGGSVVAFTSGGEGDGGPTLAYGAEISPNDNGETVTIESDDPTIGGEVVVSGTTPFTDYVVKVYGVNVAGRGNAASTAAFQLNYNEADRRRCCRLEYTRLSDNTRGADIMDDIYNGTTAKMGRTFLHGRQTQPA